MTKQQFEATFVNQETSPNISDVSEGLVYLNNRLDTRLQKAVSDICEVVIAQYDRELEAQRFLVEQLEVKVQKLQDIVNKYEVADWQSNTF